MFRGASRYLPKTSLEMVVNAILINRSQQEIGAKDKKRTITRRSHSFLETQALEKTWVSLSAQASDKLSF